MTLTATEGRVLVRPHRPARTAPARVPSQATPAAGAPTPTGFDLPTAWDDHGRALLGLATTIVGDRHAAEDVVQETFVRAWRARDRFAEHRGSVRTWLFSIVRNVAIDHLRARARRDTPVDDDGVARLLPVEESAQRHVEDRIVLAEALATLSPEHREVLVAVRLEGLSYAELAKRNGVPVATLRTRAYHALRALRTVLEEEDSHA